MIYKWMGAMLVMVGCGGAGMSLAACHRRQERMLHQLMRGLQAMECELKYRLTPLPELCRLAGRESGGQVREVFVSLARELDCRRAPDACSCMYAALKQSRELPGNVRRLLVQLGRMLGRYELEGQLQGIHAVKAACRLELERLGQERDSRLRSYQTLGFCAGAALVILFL